MEERWALHRSLRVCHRSNRLNEIHDTRPVADRTRSDGRAQAATRLAESSRKQLREWPDPVFEVIQKAKGGLISALREDIFPPSLLDKRD